MAGWPGDPPLRFHRVADLQAHGAQVTEIRMSVHVGTHIDAPLHCLAGGADVADLPLGRLCGPAVVVDLRGAHEAGVSHLRSAPIRAGDRVLLRFNAAGSGGPAPGAPGVPFISPEAARWLVDSGVSLLGLDTASPDPSDSDELPVHRVLLSAGVPILENLDLTEVGPGRYELIVLPLAIRGCEAAPARAILGPSRM